LEKNPNYDIQVWMKDGWKMIFEWSKEE